MVVKIRDKAEMFTSSREACPSESITNDSKVSKGKEGKEDVMSDAVKCPVPVPMASPIIAITSNS